MVFKHKRENSWDQLRIIREHVAGISNLIGTLTTQTLIVANKADGAMQQSAGLALEVRALTEGIRVLAEIIMTTMQLTEKERAELRHAEERIRGARQ